MIIGVVEVVEFVVCGYLCGVYFGVEIFWEEFGVFRLFVIECGVVFVGVILLIG